jgi:hypothetical protein
MNILERRDAVVTHLADSEAFYLVVSIPGPEGKTMVFQAKGSAPWKHVQDVGNLLSPIEAAESAKKITE